MTYCRSESNAPRFKSKDNNFAYMLKLWIPEWTYSKSIKFITQLFWEVNVGDIVSD